MAGRLGWGTVPRGDWQVAAEALILAACLTALGAHARRFGVSSRRPAVVGQALALLATVTLVTALLAGHAGRLTVGGAVLVSLAAGESTRRRTRPDALA